MKTLVIDAIIGAGFAGSFTLGMQAEKAGLAQYAGDTNEARWVWIRSKLEAETLENLQDIYEGLRAERETPSLTKTAFQMLLQGAH